MLFNNKSCLSCLSCLEGIQSLGPQQLNFFKARFAGCKTRFAGCKTRFAGSKKILKRGLQGQKKF